MPCCEAPVWGYTARKKNYIPKISEKKDVNFTSLLRLLSCDILWQPSEFRRS
jgi:hypothetical protein